MQSSKSGKFSHSHRRINTLTIRLNEYPDGMPGKNVRRLKATALDPKDRSVYAQRVVISKIKEAREKLRLSYEAMSKASGLNVSTLHGMLTGDTKEPTWVVVEAAARAVGIRFELIDESGSKILAEDTAPGNQSL